MQNQKLIFTLKIYTHKNNHYLFLCQKLIKKFIFISKIYDYLKIYNIYQKSIKNLIKNKN